MQIRINNQTFATEVMNTPEELSKGMMGRNHLDGSMLFNVGKGDHSFWMKDCLIPLDIIFVLNNKITKIYNDCQPCENDCDKRYRGLGDHVIEFPANTSQGWKIGDKVKFIN